MSSTRDPILMLEPSNLLEPLNLADQYGEPASSSTRDDEDGTSKRFRRPTRKDPISTPIERAGRWRLKSALLVAGAFACFAAGSALPQLPELAFGDGKPAQQAKPAQQTKSVQQTIAEATKQPIRIEKAPADPAEAKPAEPKPNEPVSNGSNESIALTANPGAQSPAADRSAPTAQNAPASGTMSCRPQVKPADDKCLEGGVLDPAAGSTRTTAPDRNSDSSPRSAPAASRTTGASTAKSPAGPHSIWEIDERSQQSVNRRAAPRDAADQPAATDNNDQSSKTWDRDRRQDQDSNRASSRRRERSAGDNGQAARYGASRQDQDFNRNSGWRRDRDDEYARGEDRRGVGRAPREDDRVISIGPPRHEGPLPILPSLFGW